MEAEQPFKWTFFLETGVERAKVPHTPQSTAYHSIVQLYVCGCWRCGGADPSGSDNAQSVNQAECDRIGLTLMPVYGGFFCSKTAGTTAGAHKWSRNGPEKVLFWSRLVGAGDVHSRPDRAETLGERILRSAKALPQQQEGAHDACPEPTLYRRIRVQSPQGGPQDRSGSPHVLAHRIGGGGRGLHRRDRHVY